jgi:2-oxoglutarate dehydrogenase E2 component (dihydrolipoamide succinyltransferase)
MPTEVVMPQMGESIAEGTIVRWIKQVGDRVDRDEPLFEISTDKVDAEIPSPVAGVVAEIRVKEGETVPVNSVVAVIGAGAEQAVPKQPPAAAPPPPVMAPVAAAAPVATQPAAPSPEVGAPVETPEARAGSAATLPAAAPPPVAGRPAPASIPAPSAGEASSPERQRSSPLVRRIAKERGIDISQIHGSGIGGRVTKDDILAFIDSRQAKGVVSAVQPHSAAQPASAAVSDQPPATPAARPGPQPGTVQPMSVMRKRIAEHMVLSRRTSAHVHSVFEVNFGRVAQARDANKAEYERTGAKLTFLSFIVKAAADALRAVPVVNASVDGESVVYHKDVNIGIAVALDWGLIVPVVKNADEKSLLGLSRSIADLAGRARAKQLKPEEVTGGTFTITNPGVFGALFGMPIINQPQVAILGVGHIEKRPVVIGDAIAIRPMAYLSLGYDHRLIDGAVADEFMSHVKRLLESWDPAAA